MARRASISQPHLHNVLKGIRLLSPDAADRLMQTLETSVPLLVWSAASGPGAMDISEISAVPILRSRIGPGAAASLNVFRGYMPFPVGLVANLNEPLAGYLAADLSLPPALLPGDLVLLDQNPVARLDPPSSSCWIVAENAGLRVRYVRRTRGGLELSSRPESSESREWRSISLQGRNILEIVRARIVWIGREMETPLAGSPRTSGPGD